MESSLSMGGAINLITLFGQNYTLEQQHNLSRPCDIVSYTKKEQKITIFSQYYQKIINKKVTLFLFTMWKLELLKKQMTEENKFENLKCVCWRRRHNVLETKCIKSSVKRLLSLLFCTLQSIKSQRKHHMVRTCSTVQTGLQNNTE